MNSIILPDGRCYNDSISWDIDVKYAKEIEYLNEKDLFKLKLNKRIFRESIYGKFIKREMETIGDYWEDLLGQTKANHEWISKQIEKKVDSFAVLRIGLYQLKHQKIGE